MKQGAGVWQSNGDKWNVFNANASMDGSVVYIENQSKKKVLGYGGGNKVFLVNKTDNGNLA